MGYKHNKADILQVGYDVIRKNGYHNVGINQILKAAGIPKGSFYNFFTSKEDFAQQLVAHYGERNAKWIQSILDAPSSSAMETLKRFYETVIGSNERDGYASGCLVNNLGNEVGRLSDAIAAEADAQFDGWLGQIAEVVTRGQEEGDITDAYTSMEIAEYLHSGIYGTFFKMKVTRSRVSMDRWLEMTLAFMARKDVARQA